MSQEMQQIEGLVKGLQESFVTFQEVSTKNAKETSEKTEKRLNEVVTDFTTKFEQLQSNHSKLQAVIERVGTAANDNEKLSPEQKASNAAFEKLCRLGKGGLTPEELKALSTDVNPSGGYLVPIQQLGIINGRVFETSPLRRTATVISTSAKSVEAVLDDDEASSGWAGEGDTIVETNTPNLGRIEIACHKQYAFPKMTDELVQDSAFDVVAWLLNKVGDKFGRTENSAFVSGDGVKQPRGFLTYPAWDNAGVYQRKALERINSGSTTVPTEAGLINLQASLKEAYQANARWYMNRSTFAAIMKLNGSSNYRFLNFQPATGPNGLGLGGELTLMGKPIVLLADMPNIGTDSLSIAYGDMSQAYTITDRVGISVKQDGVTSPGFVKFYATKRVGGDVTNFEALKLQKFNT